MNANIEINEEEEGGSVNMCKALEEWGAEIEARGEAIGEARGEARNLMNMIERYMKKHNTALMVTCEMLDVTPDEYNAAKELLEGIV